MSKEFVRNIRNTTVNEPFSTNEQNDIISDKDNIYIRNKNSYFPLTKSILKIKATDTIVSVVENINGTENTVTLETNENILNDYIKKNTNVDYNTINELISTSNGIEKNILDGKIDISTNYNIDEIYNQVNTNKNTIDKLNKNTYINILYLNNNFNEIYQELEEKTDSINILKYNEDYFLQSGKNDNGYYFYNIYKKNQDPFIDYQLIQISENNGKLFRTSITPSEVITL